MSPSIDATVEVAAPVPPDASPAAGLDAADFIDVSALLPTLRLDMRYAGTNNFTGKVIYPVARCLLRRDVALALARVQERLQGEGLQLLVWDCYRPFSVQEAFWKLVPDKRYVAKPRREKGRPVKGSKHNRGAAIDLSLASAEGEPLDMPTDHDDFSERAHWNAPEATEPQRRNAQRLRDAMEAEGFVGIDTEWWHYDHHSWQDYELSDESL